QVRSRLSAIPQVCPCFGIPLSRASPVMLSSMETRETYPYPPLNLAQQRSMRRQVPRKFRVWNFRRFAYVSPEKCPEKCLGSGRPTSLEHGGFAEADSDKGVVALASSNNVAGFVDKLGEGEGVAHHL